ncbi:hypothetical protein L226DRAFT_536441 [Lentinus tigrinus ALCF2SS1-7]|uniref:uncharacterized protein n=1 Tax=Lentinus tigrinus ALCF2SS1-7 TaxID=1328758 RepID=UPI001165DD4B|nr:hypothetical protein L226DRAFT_536441 [Lentinus tigrinus ALCF2SS1-7]
MPPRLRLPDPAYPSFTLAGIAFMTGQSSAYCRVPTYRGSHLRRFHPYGRVDRPTPFLVSVLPARC